MKNILCMLGIHHHIEKIDKELTQHWDGFARQWSIVTTPCTYLECTRCGHTYGTRTIGFEGKFTIEGEG
jgi:hypothetical protein